MPFGIRPTSDVMRKSLFDFLDPYIQGCDFIDIFSGSGAVGLEAMSRGACNVTFVEKDLKAASVIEENLMLLALPLAERKDRYFNVYKKDALSAIKELFSHKKAFDIVFIDPPYGKGLVKKALKILEGYDILKPNSLLIFQHEKHEALPQTQGRFSVIRVKKFGSSLLTIYRRTSDV